MKRTFAFLSLALGAQALGQNLVVNGDFSNFVPATGAGGGWTAVSNDVNAGWSATGGNPGGTYILNDDAKPNANPTIQQALTLVPGQVYRVSGQFAAGHIGYGGYPTKEFGVEIDGNLWEYFVPEGITLWTSFSQTFTATSSNVTLSLSGERHDDGSVRVDNISVQAVPEPASMAALGFGAVGLLRRRRNKIKSPSA